MEQSLDRSLGRVEARVSDLTTQITSMRQELSQLAHTVESGTAAHRERLSALESFRRWMIGVMTGMFLSGVATLLALLTK